MTSLESFHLHLAWFIPGSSANAVNFQAYLLEGIRHWNQARTSAAIQSQSTTLRTFNTALKHRANAVSQAVHRKDTFPLYQPPERYTGELFGIEYLFEQNGKSLQLDDDQLAKEVDEGIDVKEISEADEVTSCSSSCLSEDISTFSLPVQEA